jgi:hypothetical protein
MDSGSLNRSCPRALTIAWLHMIRPTHLCLVYEREIVGPGSMTAHYCTKKENDVTIVKCQIVDAKSIMMITENTIPLKDLI